jgi:hypothetical protein
MFYLVVARRSIRPGSQAYDRLKSESKEPSNFQTNTAVEIYINDTLSMIDNVSPCPQHKK